MNLYSKIRSKLTTKSQGNLTKLLVYCGIKPTFNKVAKSLFEKGIVVFSADFEMAWAFRFSKTNRQAAVEKGLQERYNVPILLNLFDKNQIPVTWAIVGHLFLNNCARNNLNFAHNEMPRPSYFENPHWIFNSGDWYDNDPCTDYKTDPAWYAPDLVEQIIKSKVNHEIGCHTFSHIDFTYKNCTHKLAEAELNACIKLAEEKVL
jgi:hypothetical protein